MALKISDIVEHPVQVGVGFNDKQRVTFRGERRVGKFMGPVICPEIIRRKQVQIRREPGINVDGFRHSRARRITFTRNPRAPKATLMNIGIL